MDSKKSLRETSLQKAHGAHDSDDRDIAKKVRSQEIRSKSAESVWPLVAKACSAQRKATREGDSALVIELQKFVKTVARTEELRILFGQHGKIDGEDGVAHALGITRYATYLQIESLGLSPANFKSPEVTIESLIASSNVLSQLVKETRRLLGEEKSGVVARAPSPCK
jgi:hypothetical protein